MSAEPASSLGHVPAGAWTFDEGVTAVFEDMLRRSIPLYPQMRAAVADLAAAYIQPRTAVIDLGCSRGEAIDPLVRRFGAQNTYIGCEVSEPMLEACRARFRGLIEAGVVDIRRVDLRTDYPSRMASVTLAVLTLQFIPIEHRPALVRRAFEHTLPGGALIVVEKVLSADAAIGGLLADRYHALKAENGYSQDEITRKRLALEGVLVPLTARWNEELLAVAGFEVVECFWRWMNFAGWIAVRPK